MLKSSKQFKSNTLDFIYGSIAILILAVIFYKTFNP